MATQLKLNDRETIRFPVEEPGHHDKLWIQSPDPGILDHLARLPEKETEPLGRLMHAVKNHLVSMQMSAEVLFHCRQFPPNPRLKLMLEHISRSYSEMLAFVNRFLANAADGHPPVMQLRPVCFAEAALRSVRQFREAARRKRLVVRMALPRKGALVQADPEALNQVLDNLVSNAVKFSPAGKRITVLVRPASSRVECQIQDQGPGFTLDDQNQMFRRYGTFSAQPTGGEASAGLGLSIVKKLMDEMRGELDFESSAGKGARFSLRLPAAACPDTRI